LEAHSSNKGTDMKKKAGKRKGIGKTGIFRREEGNASQRETS